MKKVLITDGVHPLLIEGFEKEGFTCDYQTTITLEEVHQIVADYEGLIINSKIIVDKRMLDNGLRLKFIGRLGSGMEIIDQEYAKEKGVHVFSAPEGNQNAVAEHALGMLLALANNFLQADAEVRAKDWNREKNRGFEIMGKTIGLIGFGHTGSSFAKKLEGCGVKVLAYDKYKTDYTEGFSYVEQSTTEKIVHDADIISLHLPLTKETHHIIDDQFLEKCKNGVILINTSRGKCIKTESLLKGLTSGKIGGACLDVFENEKTATFSEIEHRNYDQLYTFKNVILSPHVAGWTHESKERLSSVLLSKIKTIL